MAAVHGTVRFIGFSTRKARPQQNVRVPDLFVPLRLTPRGRRDGQEAEPWSTGTLVQRLATPGDGAARLVALGKPGSGKTTLCRFAAVAVAEAADDVLPLFLPFRDYVRQDGVSIVGYLTEQARNHLQVPLPDGFLEDALETGRAVLILDGLDEVGSAGERGTTCEKVQAFVAAHPKVPVLVTSRPAGYDDAPLPDAGPVVFEHLELRPFDDGELRDFVERWYELQEPADPVARDQGAAGLQAALAARPQVRELARNPLLATLIALVHRTEASLPGERAELYDRCVATLVETWPRARGREFEGLDLGRQRAYLEALPWRMQCSREDDERDVTIERDDLVTTLAEVIARRAAKDDTEDRRLVERWVAFLEKGSGLLVEQRPGVFGFFHLSLMEYLAAQELLRRESPADEIARRYRQPGWREVCLLAVGSRATDKGFLDRVFERVSGEEDAPSRWGFLFEAMREEADFDDAQRDAVGRAVALEMLDAPNWDWHHKGEAFTEILQLSLRHAGWAARWLDERFAAASGDELRGLVLLRLKQWQEARGKLERRPDRADARILAGIRDRQPPATSRGCRLRPTPQPAPLAPRRLARGRPPARRAPLSRRRRPLPRPRLVAGLVDVDLAGDRTLGRADGVPSAGRLAAAQPVAPLLARPRPRGRRPPRGPAGRVGRGRKRRGASRGGGGASGAGGFGVRGVGGLVLS